MTGTTICFTVCLCICPDLAVDGYGAPKSETFLALQDPSPVGQKGVVPVREGTKLQQVCGLLLTA